MESVVNRHRNQVILASGLDFLAGVWLIISPFVLHFQTVRNAAAIDGFFGILICVLAFMRMFAYMYSSLSRINAIFGLWIAVSPFLVGFYTFHTALLNNIITGVVIIILASWSATATRAARHQLPGSPMAR